MAKRAGTYKSEKRKKEINRLKKQEEKRQRRLSRATQMRQGSEETAAERPEENTGI